MNFRFKYLLLIGLFFGTAYAGQSQNTIIELSTNKVVVSGQTYFLHVVKEKQTLFSICKAYGVELSSVLKCNYKTEPVVKIGEVLRIPISNSNVAVAPILVKKEDAKFYYHVVKKGDTLFSLYKTYGVSIDDIRGVNPTLEENLTIGSVVKIPKAEKIKEVKSVPQHDNKYYYYVIKEGDTEYSITNKFLLKLKTFRKLNPEIKGKPLVVGGWVRIPRYLVPPEYFVEKKIVAEIPEQEITEADKFVDESYGKGNIQNKIKIGLFLPLFLDANDSINQFITYRDTLEIITERNPKVLYSKSKDFLRFYQGILLSVDSLRNEGLSIDLHVFDTERSVEKVNKILSGIQYINFDFFIGPIYSNTFPVVAEFAQSKKIPIISPLSGKNAELKTNPYVIQLNTSIESICENISEYVCSNFEMKNMVVIHPENFKHLNEYKLVTDIERKLFEDGKYWDSGDLNYQKISFDNFGLSGIERLLCDTCENIIIIPSTDQPIVENIITNLNVLSHQYDFRVMGFPVWQRYNSMDAELFYNLNLSVLSPYFVDYKRNEIESFVGLFRKRFGCEPNDFSFRAFDLCRYFSLAVGKFGKEFPEHLNDSKTKLLQSAYYFKRESDFGGLENVGAHFVNYSRDFKIRHHISAPPENNREDVLIKKSFEY